jgi:hypothetical protein
MPKINLKPCPFCGRPATTSFWTLDRENRGKEGWIGCRNCMVIMPYYNLPQYMADTVERWNRRVSDDQDRAKDTLCTGASQQQK